MRLIDADATVQYLREFRCKDCDRRKGMKNGKIHFCYEIGDAPCRACDIGDTIDYFLDEDISPTIDVLALLKEQEAKKGHWIVLDFCANEGIYCSKCHMKIFDRTTKPKKKLSQYCPHCGSRNEQFVRDGEVVFR